MSELLEYPFVLADGTVAVLSLPVVLTAEDAERLCGMIHAVAFEGPQAATPV